MSSSRTIVVAGAGIGGLTTALALAARGFRVICLEKADELREIGAGLQITPNASRVLRELGLAEPLAARVVVPEAAGVVAGRTGRALTRITLGDAAEFRYGAPYWVVHRGELQSVLLERARDNPDIEIRLGTQFEDAAVHANGVTVMQREGLHRHQEPAIALIGADGVWSAVRRHLDPHVTPRFGGRTAWRGLVQASQLPRAFARAEIQLWLGRDAHLVLYPVRGGRTINIVAIVNDTWNRPGWSEAGEASRLMEHFAAPHWNGTARMLIGAVESWTRWALFELPDPAPMARDAIALVGDAAHAMMPFLAQGAAMAIEDASVLARCLAEAPRDVPNALRRYEGLRRTRVARIQRAARQNGQIYHLSGPAALARNFALQAMGAERLLARHDWIYDWRAR